MPGAGVSCRVTAGSTGRRAVSQVVVSGVFAGQAGLLARVMTAGAVRVPVPARPARGKVLAHLALRARCRFRSMTVQYFASSLASAVQLVFPARIAAVTARR